MKIFSVDDDKKIGVWFIILVLFCLVASIIGCHEVEQTSRDAIKAGFGPIS